MLFRQEQVNTKTKKAYDRKANKRAIRKEMNTYPTSNGSYNLNLNMVINPQI